MPHQCTSCGRVFPDGSKEMLSGCPDCGGNKFQFHPGRLKQSRSGSDRAGEDDGPGSRSSDGSDSSPKTRRESDRRTDWASDRRSERGSDRQSDWASDRGSERVADRQSERASDRQSEAGPDAQRSREETKENEAQAEARSDVVSPDELEGARERTPPGETARRDGPAERREPTEDPEDRPEIDELRAELNEQFESIRIVNPGQYELNLMELYDREEYIISLREDGRYVIEVPDAWDAMDE